MSDAGGLAFDRSGDGTLRVRLSGRWTLRDPLPSASEVASRIDADVRRIEIDADGLSDWDSALLVFLLHLREVGERAELEVDTGSLPEGAARLLSLATAVPHRTDAHRRAAGGGPLAALGRASTAFAKGAREMVEFIGQATLSFGRLVTGRAGFQVRDFWVAIEDCGANALPIVTLISVLVGMILAFVGAVQLEQFGAEIYVANLVGLAMAREMGAMMTAIIMAGRTGAAFAAQIGTMRVNEEIDALTTLGFSPVDFLVLPRLLALAIMMPLLCVYADAIGILGGMIIGVGMLDLAPALYWDQTVDAVDLADFAVGLSKSAVFGVLVAVAGCLRGMQCGTDSAAVGLATTSAVVTAIVAVITTDAIFTVVFDVLGI